MNMPSRLLLTSIGILYLTWTHSKGQGQNCPNFDGEYLRNGDRYGNNTTDSKGEVVYELPISIFRLVLNPRKANLAVGTLYR